MDVKHCLVIMMFLMLEGGVLANGQTMRPNYGSTSSNNNANSANNAIRNSTRSTVTRTSTMMTTRMKPSAKSILLVTSTARTKMPLLAQKLESSKATPSMNRTAANRSADSRDNDSGLPLWAYILIGVVGVVLLIGLVCLAYTKFIKWKDHGTYMVWDDAELETSPAFTRESEFLLETSTGGQEMVSPELQLYEIPLDSVTHPRIAYIGSKRVAPKRMDDKARKRDGDYNVPSLTRYKKRDTVYNSVTDTCMTSVMSEGTLDGGGSISRHTLATVMLSNGGLDKYGSTSHHFDNTSTKGVPGDKSYSMDNRTKSVSNLIQSRPLPAVPINKRFSKSMDKLRFFNTLPVIKPISHRKLPLPAPPSYANMIRSASYGSNLQRTVNNNISMDPPQFCSRKCSLDLQTKTSPQKSSLSSHRKSKSLDTLVLLKENDWNAINVDIYHSYESVHGTKSENGEYASVSDSQPSSPTADSDNLSQKSPTKSNMLTPPGNKNNHESIYASLSQEDLHNTTPIYSENWNVKEGNDISYDSSTMSSLSSETTSPYATVRISQIPGLNYDNDKHEEIYCTKSPENSGGSLDTPENSGSTVGEVKLAPNSARSSTHTYLELFPEDTNRDSIISETSSGYARPVDVVRDISNTEKDKQASERQSLSNIQIPIETAVTFNDEGNGGPCSTEVGESEAYDNPVKVSDDESQKMNELKNVPIKDNKPFETEERIQENLPSMKGQSCSAKHEFIEEMGENVHVNEWPTRARSSSEHSECEI